MCKFLSKITQSVVLYLISLCFMNGSGLTTPIYIYKFAENTFSKPAALDIESVSGKVFVSDMAADTIYSFESTGINKSIFFTAANSKPLGISTSKRGDGSPNIWIMMSTDGTANNYKLTERLISGGSASFPVSSTYTSPVSIVTSTNNIGTQSKIYITTPGQEIKVFNIGTSTASPSIPLDPSEVATGLAYNSSTSYLYAALRDQNKIKVLNSNSALVASISGNSSFKPSNIATVNVSTYGPLWVVDRIKQNIQHYKNDVIPPNYYLDGESSIDSIEDPVGLTINEHTGQIYALYNSGLKGIQIYFSPEAWIKSGQSILQDLPLKDQDLVIDSKLTLPNVTDPINRRLRVSSTDLTGNAIGGTGTLSLTNAALVVSDTGFTGEQMLAADKVELNTGSNLFLNNSVFNIDSFAFDGGTLTAGFGYAVSTTKDIAITDKGATFATTGGSGYLEIYDKITGNQNATITLNGNVRFNQTNTFLGNVALVTGKFVAGADNALSTVDVAMSNDTTLAWATNATLSNKITLNGNATFDTRNGPIYKGILTGSIGENNASTMYVWGDLTTQGNVDITGIGIEANSKLTPKAPFIKDPVITLGTNAILDLSNYSQTVKDLYGSEATSKVVLGDKTLTLNSDVNTSYVGTIEGSMNASLVKTGTGNLALGSNSYGGTTQIQSGGIIITSDNSFGFSAVTMLDNTALFWTSNASLNNTFTLTAGLQGITMDTNGYTGALGKALSIPSEMIKKGVGELKLLVGGENNGTLEIQEGTFTTEGDLTNQAGATTFLTNINATLKATGNFKNAGTLLGNGNFLLDGGIFQDLNNSTLNWNFSLSHLGGTIRSGNNAPSNNVLTINNAITDQDPVNLGVLTLSGPGVIALKGNNTYAGGTALTNLATVQVWNNKSLGNNAVNLSNGITISWEADANLDNDFTLNGTSTIDTAGFEGTLSGILSGTGGLNIIDDLKIGTINGAPNTYQGATAITDNKTVTVYKTNAFGTQGTVSMGDNSTLNFANDITIANPITVIGHTAVFDTTDGNGTLNGTISQAVNTVTKMIVKGGKILTLAAQAFHEGGTEIQADTTLKVSDTLMGDLNLLGQNAVFDMTLADQSLGALQGSDTSQVLLGTRTLTLNQPSVFDGVISGTGNIVAKADLTLGGQNTHTGLLTLDASVNPVTLKMEAGSTLADTSSLSLMSTSTNSAIFDMKAASQTIGDLNGNANSIIDMAGQTLNIGTDNDSSFSGNLIGVGGRVVKQGDGLLELTGQNTFDNGLYVESGQLLAGSAQSLGQGNVYLSNLTTLSVGQSMTIANPIQLSSGGTVTFDTNGFDLSLPTPITEDALHGPAGLDIEGLGSVRMYGGAQGYNGVTTIKNGTLSLEQASLRGNTAVMPQGKLILNEGTIDSDLINQGTVIQTNVDAPSTIIGDYLPSSTAITLLAVNNDKAAKLIINGQANLNGSKLQLQAGPGNAFQYENHEEFEILSSNHPIQGQFGSVTSTSMKFRFVPDYTKDPNKVFLDVTYRPLKEIVRSVSKDSNPIRAAGYLDTLSTKLGNHNQKLNYIIDSLYSLSTDKEVAGAVSMISPARMDDMAFILAKESSEISRMPEVRLQYRREYSNALPQNFTQSASFSKVQYFKNLFNTFKNNVSSKSSNNSFFDNEKFSLKGDYAMQHNTLIGNSLGGIWVQGFGDNAKQKTTSQQYAYRAHSGGGLIGVDYKLQPDFILGGLVGYSRNRLHFEHDILTGNIKDYFTGIYSTWYRHNFYLDTSMIVGFNRYRSDRKIKFAAIDLTAKGVHQGYRLSPHIGLGYTFNLSDILRLTPFLKLDYTHVHENGYKEKNADALNLRIRRRNYNLLNTEMGINLSTDFIGDSGIWTPKAKIGVINNRVLHKDKIRANLLDQPITFEANIPLKSQTLLAPGLSIGYVNASGLFSSVGYVAQVGCQFKSHEVNARLGWKF